MNKILKITIDDLWDECGETNVYKYNEVIKCKEYEEILEKLEKVNVYDCEALYFEITKKSIKMKCLYTSVCRYLESEEVWETADKIVYFRTAGFHEVEYLSDTAKVVGDDIVETIIYKEGTESEAYRKQMRANNAHFYFTYKDRIETTALDIGFSVELKSKDGRRWKKIYMQ